MSYFVSMFMGAVIALLSGIVKILFDISSVLKDANKHHKKSARKAEDIHESSYKLTGLVNEILRVVRVDHKRKKKA